MGVFEMWSSPRMMWVISIDASSTTTAKLYSGVPSLRTITKSPPMLAVSISTSPRTRSCQATLAGLDPEAEGGSPALGLARGALLGGGIRAATDVPRRLVGCLLRLPVGVELLRRAVARVGEVTGEEVRGRRDVARAPLHLAIRRERPVVGAAGAVGSLVPADPEPVQVLEDVLLERDRVPREVGVFEAKDERAAGPAGVQVVEQRRPRRPDVQRAGRARGDADAGC